MAGFRIDINDGRNKPVEPLQPPGGTALPPTTAPAQGSNEASTAQTIGDVVDGGTHDGVSTSYDAGTRTIDIVNTDKGSVAVAAHVALADPHTQYVEKAGDTMTGALVGVAGTVTVPSFGIGAGNTGWYHDGSQVALTQSGLRTHDFTTAGGFRGYRTGVFGPSFGLLQSNGTLGTPTATASSDILGFIAFQGYTGSAYLNGGLIFTRAREAWSGTASGTEMVFRVTTPTTNSNLDVLTLRDDNIRAHQPLRGADGTVSLPAYTFNSDQDTGFYKHGTNSIGVTCNGTEIANWTSAGYTIGGDNQFAQKFEVYGASGVAMVVGRNSNDANAASYALFKSRGTGATDRTAVQSGDTLGIHSFQGADGSTNVVAATCTATAQEAFTGSARGTRLQWSIIRTGESSITNVFRLQEDGQVLAISRAGLGYGTGAGNVVTQLVSKTTSVTSNAPCGNIVTHNAALNANTRVQFTVNSTSVASTDAVIIHRATGGTANSYAVSVDSIASGSFVVTLHNYSGGSLSEAITLRYSVIKGVTA
jgi:hypothetical protein